MNNLTFEFQLISNSDDVVIAADGTTSTTWQIENPMIQADLCTIDNALQNRFDQHMLEGKNISIPYQQIITSTQTTVASKDISINIIRSCSRPQKLYCTMYNASGINTKTDRKRVNTFL